MGIGIYRRLGLGTLSGVAIALGLGLLFASASLAATPLLSLSATSATVGQTIQAQATLSESAAASGEISFEVFGPADPTCSGPALTPAPAPAPVAGDNAYLSGTFTPLGAGTYRWSAHYPGDPENEPVDSNCTAESTVAQAIPALTGKASAALAGSTITDSVTLTGSFAAGGQIVFRAFGPDDKTCATVPKYEQAVAVTGDDTYSPPGFAPPGGLYRWTAEYSGDADNQAASLPCDSPDQASAVGRVPVTLAVTAADGPIGAPVSAAATIREGGIPGGQISFQAFPPGNADCSGAAAFSSVVAVTGNGSYRSAAFAPARVGAFRWTVSYSGDANHTEAASPCGKPTSSVTQARPSILGGPGRRLLVGARFQAEATLAGGYSPSGTISFRIYGPVGADCTKPIAVNTVAVAGNGSFRSDPFAPQRPGLYRFVAGYSGDTANQEASEACATAGQLVKVLKRTPRVKPRARLNGSRQISIRAHLSGAASPSGVIGFRLYGPGDKRCKGKPAFSGSLAVTSNGGFLLAKYLATKRGIYRLSVGYSGDRRNRRDGGSCNEAQRIRVG